MVRDPLDLFNSTGGQDYPGKRAPKNREQCPQSSMNGSQDLPHSEYLIDGKKHRFYTIGALSKALMRAPVTVRSWESKGWIPPAGFRTPAPRGKQIPDKAIKGRRLYTEAQLVFLVEGVIQFNINGPKGLSDWPGFRNHIAKHYPTH